MKTYYARHKEYPYIYVLSSLDALKSLISREPVQRVDAKTGKYLIKIGYSSNLH